MVKVRLVDFDYTALPLSVGRMVSRSVNTTLWNVDAAPNQALRSQLRVVGEEEMWPVTVLTSAQADTPES